jgi:hypothetical protein
MRSVSKSNRTVIRYMFFILIIFTLISGSCSSRKKKLDRSGLVPEKELVPILAELYITDGLLVLPKVHTWFPSLDSASSYIHIIEKHGYTKESMDKTMKFYFIKKPKKLIQIYDQVLGILSEMEARVDKEANLFQAHLDNLWTGKDVFILPDPKGNNSFDFNIPLVNRGMYVLTFTATLFPDDQSLNPRFTAFTCHRDSIDTGKRQYFESVDYIKDGKPHTYSLVFKVPGLANRHLRGRLFDFDNNPEISQEHGIFENISINYSFQVE